MDKFADISNLTCLKLNFSVFAQFSRRNSCSSQNFSLSWILPQPLSSKILILILLMKLSKCIFLFFSFYTSKTVVQARITSGVVTTTASQTISLFDLLPTFLLNLDAEQEVKYTHTHTFEHASSHIKTLQWPPPS